MFRPVGALRLFFGVCALSACVVGSPCLAQAAESDRDRAAARSAADSGADAYEQQRYADSLELFGRAEKLVHATPHLLFMARSLVKLGRLVEAHETYLKIQREKLSANAPNAFKRAQAEAEKEIAEVAPRLAYATVRIDGASSDAVQVLMDENELPAAVVGIAFPVDPGSHVFRAQAGSDRSEPVTVRFDEGARHGIALKITLTQKPATATDPTTGGELTTGGAVGGGPNDAVSHGKPRNKTLLITGSVLTGLGAIGTGIGVYFLASSASHRNRGDDLFASCDPTPAGCTDPQKAYIKQQDKQADDQTKRSLYGFIPGGALLATGVVLLIVNATTSGDSARATPPRTTLVGGSNWLGVSTQF